MDYDFDLIQYCEKCKHWFVCKQSDVNHKLSSKSVASHDEHVAAIRYAQARAREKAEKIES